MRRFLLVALALLAIQTVGQAQTLGNNTVNAGRPQSSSLLPSWADMRMSLARAFGNALTLGGMMPSFRDRGIAPGSITTIPDPDVDPNAYLNGFGLRRFR
jgi:hypothetical protein